MQKTLSLLLIFAIFCVALFVFVSPVDVSALPDLPKITFNYGDLSWTYDASKHEKSSFCFQSIGQKYGRWGDNRARANLLRKVRDLGFSPEVAMQYCFVGIEPIIKNIKSTINRNPVNATYKFNPNNSQPFTFTHEKNGFLLDFDQILNDLANKLEKSYKVTLNLTPKVLMPDVFYEDIKDYSNLRASFHTSFNGEVENRKHNIKLATSALNGLKITNGTEFSFNSITGKRSPQNGYKPARVILDKKYVEDFGGGVCQVSTTLYNALLLAGLDITELHSHSLTSNYVNLGFDAMVNYGTSDLCWVNNTNSPMFLRGFVKNNQVYFEIYGKPNNKNYTYKRVTEIEKTIEPKADEIVIDEKLEYTNLVNYTDETAYITVPKKGYKVRAILETYNGVQLIERKLLRRVTYHAVQGVKVVGTKTRPVQEPQNGSTEEQTTQSSGLAQDIVNFWQNFF